MQCPKINFSVYCSHGLWLSVYLVWKNVQSFEILSVIIDMKNTDVVSSLIMNKLFSNESVFGILFGHLGDIIIVNLLFVVTSLPVVTMGAALSGMNYAFLKRRRLSDEPISRLYFDGFKANFRQATAAWLATLFVFAFFAVDIYAFSDKGPLTNPLLAIICTSAVLVCYFTVLYLFAVIPAFDNDLRSLAVQSFSFAAGHLALTIPMAFFPAALIGIMLTGFFAFAFVTSMLLLFGCGLFGWLYSFIYIRVFSPFLD